LSFVVVTAETSLEIRQPEISTKLIAVDAIPATSRGPPLIWASRCCLTVHFSPEPLRWDFWAWRNDPCGKWA